MLLEIPIRVSEFGSKELFNALIACSVIQDSQRRRQLINLLDKSIANNIGSTDSPNDTVISILEAFRGFPNKIDELLEAIKRLDSESTEYKNLYKVIFEIAIRQQKQNIESVSTHTPTTFEELKIGLNDRDETFESLWSKICPILDEIDWKYIWEACCKIENFIKNDEISIKSLCFTKNYKLLKQIFLDRYDSISIIIELGKLLKPYNQKIELWLKNIQDIHEPDQNDHEDVFCFPPILLIIVDRLGDGKDQDKWNVRGQLKLQGKTSEILLSKNKNGIDCSQFESIPIAIKSYIDYLENEPRFRDQAIDELRIEVFIPLFELHSSLDNWAMICEEEAHRSLVENYRLFLRSRERVRKNSRIGLLRKGWDKIDIFLKSNCREISKTTLAEEIKDTQVSNIIEILENTQISNWKELEIFMKNCSSLWGIRLKGSLSIDKFERMRFFESIFDSGIPIAVWNWDSIPSQVKFEQKFTECLCRDNLSNRCCGLLEKTWELRSILWGARTETERKQYPGYYLGMLLEDPEILPEENPLQTIGVNR
jgi:hypothetical protein